MSLFLVNGPLTAWTFLGDGIDGKTSSEIKDVKVKKYPPCFRCGLYHCKHKNKEIHPFLIGNFLSHIKVWKKIINEELPFTLICEDDLYFSNYSSDILLKIFSEKVFLTHDIDLINPLLFRMGYGRAKVKGLFKNAYTAQRLIHQQNYIVFLLYLPF